MRVRIEHLDEPLGIGRRAPRLSWRLPPGSTVQERYEVRRDDGFTSGVVEGPDNVLVPWPGPSLASGERREVRVRVWTDLGAADWSEPAVVEAGLLEPSDWSAAWIGPEETVEAEPGFRPAYRLRGTFDVHKSVAQARLYAAAHGVYEASIDGVRVGDVELAPGFTEYASRTQVQTYDVTALLGEGSHTLELLLADGWFRGSVGMLRAVDQFGDRTAAIAQLHLRHTDGTTAVHGTDGSWRSSPSHVRAADLIEGQWEDRRLLHVEPTWLPVQLRTEGYDALVASPAPPVRAIETLRPVAVTDLGDRGQVFDFGQNVNGRTRVTRLGAEGTTLTVTHAEWLGPDGDVTTEHLRPQDIPFLDKEVRAGQVDVVVSAGRDGDAFDPRFTTHGFQYARIAGQVEPLTADDVSAVVVHSDLAARGGFTCSDPRINALHDAAVWSLRGNVCAIPTDCPTRERAGWTGDWQVYVPTATFLYDVAGFSTSWLRDVAAGQWDDGIVNNMSPMPPAERTGFLERLNGSAGWGDACVLVPWELFEEYGDREVLAELWPAMVRWLQHVETSAAAGRHPDRVAARPVPAPHETWLWDTGFHWGEWLVPGEDPSDFPAFVAADKSDVATAFYSWTAGRAADIAAVLGREDAEVRYRDLSRRAAQAWRAEFVDADGRVIPDSQGNLVRALRFGLVDPAGVPLVADQLADAVRANGDHLGTGFLATGDLLPTLAEHGHLDVAYDLLFQDSAPSWLTMIDRGATTVWERWEGVDEDGVPHESLNHYSKGAVISFLHRHVAGLRRTSPTWRTFGVAPRPGHGLTEARAWHDSPHGRHEATWRIEDGRLTLEVEVPPGTTAEVTLPSGRTTRATPGRHTWTEEL